MAWRLARSLQTLRDQVNVLSPNRSKVSDGSIGNAEHASRSSDHNPWVKDGNTGVVTAIDITDDEARGVDNWALGEALRHSMDRRIKYIIADGRIANAKSVTKNGKAYEPWAWSPYVGKNSHHHHVHISVQPEKTLYDDISSWLLDSITVAPAKLAQPVSWPPNPVLALGTKGPDVARLQELLNSKGAKLTVDSDFGPRTIKAVIDFQKSARLVQDGRVGQYTWDALHAD
ncbi:peptidoglycan-binding protein [Mesorhizobium sp. M0977]|uniref:peptidoglycan-binding domain-containing protein n=1 Tax=Mesorhizobium sp. M0977 TaxID=2957039 RepID=UPI00333A038D